MFVVIKVFPCNKAYNRLKLPYLVNCLLIYNKEPKYYKLLDPIVLRKLGNWSLKLVNHAVNMLLHKAAAYLIDNILNMHTQYHMHQHYLLSICEIATFSQPLSIAVCTYICYITIW